MSYTVSRSNLFFLNFKVIKRWVMCLMTSGSNHSGQDRKERVGTPGKGKSGSTKTRQPPLWKGQSGTSFYSCPRRTRNPCIIHRVSGGGMCRDHMDDHSISNNIKNRLTAIDTKQVRVTRYATAFRKISKQTSLQSTHSLLPWKVSIICKIINQRRSRKYNS